MLSFFKINDPLRLIVLFILLVIIRLPIWLSDIPLLTEEIHWLTLGEKLAEGKAMYRDVWDNIAPLSAGVYWFAAKFLGGSRTSLFVIAAFLTALQSLLFNSMMNRSEAYKQKTFIPGFTFLIFSNMSFDFMTLSPALISLTFLLMGLRSLLRMERTDTEQSILNTGLFFGLASLAYLPSFSFLLMGIFALASFRVSSFQRLFLAFIGFTIVWGGYLIYLYYIEALQSFIKCCFLSLGWNDHIFIQTWDQLLILMVIPAIIFVLGALKTFSYNAFVNSQQSIQQVMLIWVITAILSLVFSLYTTSFQLILFVPSLAFFSAHELLLIRRSMFGELTLWIYSTVLLVIMYATAFTVLPKKIESPYTNSFSVEVPNFDEYGEKILIFGDDFNYLKEHKLATGYLNWDVSKNFFDKIDSYDEIRAIYNAFEEDMPDAIVDLNGKGAEVLEYLTIIKTQYSKNQLDNGVTIYAKIK
ncbi:hypothetical protein [Flammeovirga agarivorans]|uniref:Glycosyltransferase RgtA/B/C/D-like domain-containing protein n=1 Tax=Flammeovirga agarivorans TaxID=2726742 RepID=A0A7X8SHX5_9BACT|nr:hypothetical protein [Flammeovirga agarivorans]NLR90551.1 hypothetical protein [Flammeovirga agarivorans]